jgi:hypothetical protein
MIADTCVVWDSCWCDGLFVDEIRIDLSFRMAFMCVCGVCVYCLSELLVESGVDAWSMCYVACVI